MPPCAHTVTGSGADMTPPPGNVGHVGMAPEREKLMAMGLPDSVIDTIQSTRAASTERL